VADSYLSGVALTRADLAGELLGTDGAGHYDGLRAAARGTERLEALDRCVAVDFASYLPDDILVKLDRSAMANSLGGARRSRSQGGRLRRPLPRTRACATARQAPPAPAPARGSPPRS